MAPPFPSYLKRSACVAAALLAPAAALSPASAASHPTQAEFLSLDDPTDDDGAIVTLFGAADQFVYVGHLFSGSVTRLNIATGVVDRSVQVGASVNMLALRAGGAELIAVDGEANELIVMDAPALTISARVPLGLSESIGLISSLNGQFALVHGTDEVAVVDLAAGAVARRFDLEDDWLSPSGQANPAIFLAADDLTLQALRATTSGAALIQTYDVPSGTLTGSLPLALPAGTAPRAVQQSGDRSVIAVTQSFFAPASAFVQSYDATTLAQLSTTTLQGVIPLSMTLSRDGSRAFSQLLIGWATFPLQGGTLSTSSAGVNLHFYGGVSSFVISGDEQRVLFYTGSSGAPWTVGSVLGPDLWPVAGPSRGFGPASSSGAGASFAVLGGGGLGYHEVLFMIDATAPTSPQLALEVPTGEGQESDGPYVSASIGSAIPGEAAILSASVTSDRLLRIDPATRTVTGAMPTAVGPTAIAPLANGAALVLHRDGTVMLMDPAGPTELDRVALPGFLFDAAISPAGSASDRAWIRTVEPAGNSLYRIDVQAGQLSVGPSLQLSAQTPDLTGGSQLGRSIQVDWSRDLAYVQSVQPGLVEVVDLAPATPVSLFQPAPPQFFYFDRVSILLSEDGLTLFSSGTSSFNPNPAAFDSAAITGGEPALRWSAPTSASPSGPGRSPAIFLSSDQSLLYADVSSSAAAGDLVALRVADGSIASSSTGPASEGLTALRDRVLLRRSTDFAFTRFDGAAFSAPEAIALPRSATSAAEFIEGTHYAWSRADIVPQAFSEEGLLLFDLSAGQTQGACAGGVPNATGVQADISLDGTLFAGDPLRLTVDGLQPNSMFGMLVLGSQLVAPFPAGLGLGRLCVGGSVGRLTSQVQLASLAGQHVYHLDTARIPTSIGIVRPQAGESWTFQGWHRDQDAQGSPTSNTSTAIEITFR